MTRPNLAVRNQKGGWVWLRETSNDCADDGDNGSNDGSVSTEDGDNAGSVNTDDGDDGNVSTEDGDDDNVNGVGGDVTSKIIPTCACRHKVSNAENDVLYLSL